MPIKEKIVCTEILAELELRGNWLDGVIDRKDKLVNFIEDTVHHISHKYNIPTGELLNPNSNPNFLKRKFGSLRIHA